MSTTLELPRPVQVELSPNGPDRTLTLRPLRSRADFDQCKALQEQVFGPPIIASPVLMKSSTEVGGLALGAFDHQDELIGSTFSVGGLRDGRPAHWTYFTAVAPGARGLGLGRRLKAYQRHALLDQGVRVAYSTFDPLAARTAHFNLIRLGSRPVEYLRHFHGETSSNPALDPVEHDRLLVRWQLDDPRVDQALLSGLDLAPDLRIAPVLRMSDKNRRQETPPRIRIRIPLDFRTLHKSSPREAMAERYAVRRALEDSLKRGYRMEGFAREDDWGFYLLSLE